MLCKVTVGWKYKFVVPDTHVFAAGGDQVLINVILPSLVRNPFECIFRLVKRLRMSQRR